MKKIIIFILAIVFITSNAFGAAVIQRAFSGGEITPSLYARTDIVRYQTSLRQMRNYITMRQGGAQNRGGFQFIQETKDSTKASRLLPFIFNSDQTYAMEFGDQYIRFYKNRAPVEVSGVSAWSNATTYVIGDLVVEGGVNYYCISGHINQQPPNATYWYPLTGVTYEIPTPYLEADLFELQIKQSADVVTIDHPSYDPRELSRTADTTWVLAAATFAPSISTPQNVTVTGGAGANTYVYHVTAIDSDTFEESLAGTKSQGSLTAPTTDDQTVTWDAVSGADEYNIYLESNSVAGFLGVSGSTTFINSSNTPDTTDTPPTSRNPFSGSDNRPATGAYHQQRNIHAGSNNNPETVEMSRSSNFNNFTKSNPIQDDDAISFTMAGNRVNRIKSLITLGKLVIMTSDGEWVVKGNSDGVVLPGEINLEQISYHGSGDLQPLLIGSSALFLQARASIVRDLVNDSIDGYISDDMTIFSAHLFNGFTIVDWAYQEVPNSIVWAVRSDGTLLGFTYIRKQEMFAWHRHDTAASGKFESVAVVPEGTEDVLYSIIKRTIDSSDVRYVETMNDRQIGDIEDLVIMDSSLSLDGTNTAATTMTISGGPTWLYTDTLTLTSSVAFFVAGDVGNQIHLTGADGEVIRFTIDGFTSTTIVTGRPNKTVPSSLQSTAVTNWGKAVDVITEIGHLEGEDISVFADGFVESSPNNASYTTLTVSGGSVELSKPYVVIHAGLPITADIETLDIDTTKGETLQDKKILINKVSSFLEKSRGLFYGSEPPSDDSTDPLEGLFELKLRNEEGYDDPTSLLTGIADIIIQSDWSKGGRVFIRQVDPLPSTILSIVPSGFIPFRD